MIRRPPRSTLFPSRRSSDLSGTSIGFCVTKYTPTPLERTRRTTSSMRSSSTLGASLNSRWASSKKKTSLRSEEHTSELQSQSNLVCRLLLEKKKKNEVYIER